MKIVNRKRFITSISITIGVIFFIILLFVNISFSHAETNYKKIAVSCGDTLWNIAKYEKTNNEYFENKEIRDIIDEIKYTNHLSTSNINVGQELSIPTF